MDVWIDGWMDGWMDGWIDRGMRRAGGPTEGLVSRTTWPPCSHSKIAKNNFRNQIAKSRNFASGPDWRPRIRARTVAGHLPGRPGKINERKERGAGNAKARGARAGPPWLAYRQDGRKLRQAGPTLARLQARWAQKTGR